MKWTTQNAVYSTQNAGSCIAKRKNFLQQNARSSIQNARSNCNTSEAKRKFKKPAFPQLTTVLVSSKEPIKNLKRIKRSAKKSTKAPAGGVVIRETPEMPLSKKKEKMDVARGNDEDDSINEQDSKSKGSDEENDSDDKNTQYDSEKGSDFEHETDEN
nr:hypothetical protein [Tanacetum cinerariifolium]